MASSRARSTGDRNGAMSTLGPNFRRCAREAGIASGTIYLYFKTKDEILVSLFRDKMAAWVAFARREIAGEVDPIAKIRRLVALHFSVLEGNPELAEVVQVELRQGHKFF